MQYYGSRISDNIATTSEGYLICVNVPIARTGEQEYLASEVLVDGGNEKVIVHRPEEEVFAKETIASFEGKPLVNDHPNEDVTVENISNYSIGHAQNVRRGTEVDSDKIIADIYVTDADAIEDIKNGKREISCGYDCAYVENADGTFTQTKIRGNHIALVDRGRAGDSVKIRDNATVEDVMKIDENTIKKLLTEAEKSLKEIENENRNNRNTKQVVEKTHNIFFELKDAIKEISKDKELQKQYSDKIDSMLWKLSKEIQKQAVRGAKLYDEDTTEVINEALTNIENEEMVEDAKAKDNPLPRKASAKCKELDNKRENIRSEADADKVYKEIKRNSANKEITKEEEYALLDRLETTELMRFDKVLHRTIDNSTEDSTQYTRDIEELRKLAKISLGTSQEQEKSDIPHFSKWLNDNKKEKDSEKKKESEFWRLKRISEEIYNLNRRIQGCESRINSLQALKPDNKKEEVLKKEAITDLQTAIKNFTKVLRELERMAKIKIGDSMKDTIKDSLTPLKDKIAKTQDSLTVSALVDDIGKDINQAKRFEQKGILSKEYIARQKAKYKDAIRGTEDLKKQLIEALNVFGSLKTQDSLKDKIADSLKSMKDKIKGTQDTYIENRYEYLTEQEKRKAIVEIEQIKKKVYAERDKGKGLIPPEILQNFMKRFENAYLFATNEIRQGYAGNVRQYMKEYKSITEEIMKALQKRIEGVAKYRAKQNANDGSEAIVNKTKDYDREKWFKRLSRKDMEDLLLSSYKNNEGNIRQLISEEDIKKLTKEQLYKKLENWYL